MQSRLRGPTFCSVWVDLDAIDRRWLTVKGLVRSRNGGAGNELCHSQPARSAASLLNGADLARWRSRRRRASPRARRDAPTPRRGPLLSRPVGRAC